MRPTNRAAALLLMFTLAASAVGCGGGTVEPSVGLSTTEGVELRDLGDLYRAYSLQKKAPPKKMADLEPFEQGNPMALVGIRAGAIQVYWGGALSNPNADLPGETPSDKVLAYEAKVPKEGGFVLLADRSIKKMTPAEFQAAPKAAAEAAGFAPASKK